MANELSSTLQGKLTEALGEFGRAIGEGVEETTATAVEAYSKARKVWLAIAKEGVDMALLGMLAEQRLGYVEQLQRLPASMQTLVDKRLAALDQRILEVLEVPADQRAEVLELLPRPILIGAGNENEMYRTTRDETGRFSRCERVAR